jgi:hypothetical protein
MASAYLSRSVSSSGSNTTATFSAWVKRAKTSGSDYPRLMSAYQDSGNYTRILFRNSDELEAYTYYQGNTNRLVLRTNRLFRDTNAWYHIVVRFDTTQSTADDRCRIYVNGVQETSFSSRTNPAQGANLKMNNSGNTYNLGRDGGGGSTFDGQMAHVHWCDGQSYAPTTFGETDSNGVWIPKTAPSVTYGTNGFFMKFDNDSNMGLDSSGNGNNLTTTGTIIQNKDTPTNNHPIINKLDFRTDDFVVTNAGLTGQTSNSVFSPGMVGIGVDSGKWYWEVKVGAKTGSSDWHLIGVTSSYTIGSDEALGYNAYDYAYYGHTGQKRNNDNTTQSYGATYGVGDIIGVALDIDNLKIYFHKNGTYQDSGDPTSGSTGTGAAFTIANPSVTGRNFYFPAVCYFDSSTNATYHFNFGSGYFGTTKITSAGSNGNGSLFEYDVPTGYYAINTENIKDQS